MEGLEWVGSTEISGFWSCQCEGELKHHSASVPRTASQNLYTSGSKKTEKCRGLKKHLIGSSDILKVKKKKKRINFKKYHNSKTIALG